MGWWILLAVVLIIVLWFVLTYNWFIQEQTRIKKALSDIDVFLKQRFDTLGGLLELLKSVTKQELDLQTQVTQLRSEYAKATDVNEKVALQKQADALSKNIVLSVEAYPEMKSNQNFLQTQEQLVQLEEKLSYSRRFFNDLVGNYNMKVIQIPSVIVASMCGFKQMEFFALSSDEERQRPSMDLTK